MLRWQMYFITVRNVRKAIGDDIDVGGAARIDSQFQNFQVIARNGHSVRLTQRDSYVSPFDLIPTNFASQDWPLTRRNARSEVAVPNPIPSKRQCHHSYGSRVECATNIGRLRLEHILRNCPRAPSGSDSNITKASGKIVR